MPTDRPRIQAYVEPHLYELFEQWKLSQGIDKDSAALNALLAEFFKTESIDPIPAPLPTEDIEKIVRAEVSSLFRIQMEDNTDFWLNRLSERVANVEQSLEKFVSLSHRQIDELKDDLGERLAACEDSLEQLTSNLNGESSGELLSSDTSSDLELIAIEGRCPNCSSDDISAIPYEIDNEVFFQCPCGWEKTYPLSLAKEKGYIPYLGDDEAEAVEMQASELVSIHQEYSEPLNELPSESDTPFPPGIVIIDKEGSYGIVIGINNLRMSVDWLGVGSCPNPPTGKGVWYDWVKDDQAIANFKPATHDRINLLTTEELLQFLAWDKNQLGDYWDGKWFDVGSHSIRWGGATVDRWVVVAQGEPDSESNNELNESSSELPSEPSNLPGFLNAANLARRLRVSNSAISRRKTDSIFTEWSKGHDPAGIGWRFPGRGQRFFPVT